MQSNSIVIYYIHPWYQVKMYLTPDLYWSSEISDAQHHYPSQFKSILSGMHCKPSQDIRFDFV